MNMKNIILFLNTFLFASLDTYASDRDWSEEQIKELLVLSQREADLDLVDDLIQSGQSADQIAVLLGIDASASHKGGPGPVIVKPDCEADSIMAQFLHAELNGHGLIESIGSTKDLPQLKIKREIMTTLQQIQEESTKYQNGDVHLYNKGIVIKYRDFCHKLCEALDLKHDIPVDQLSSRILEHASPSLNQSLSKLNSHQLNVIDGETGLKIDHMLSYITDICHRLYSLPHRQNAYQYMVESLAENIDAGGGCKPGYAGRFFRDLLELSSVYLNNADVEIIE